MADSARKKPTKAAFTKEAIERLPVPQTGRVYVYDTRTPGLAVCVTDRGARTFYLYRRIDGRPVRLRLGRFPAMTVANARKALAVACGGIAQGRNPHVERQSARRDMALRDMYEHYHAYLVQHGKDASEAEYRYRCHIEPYIGASTAISKISKRAVLAMRDQVVVDVQKRRRGGNGNTTSNHAIKLVGAMFNRLANDEKWSGDNPARQIAKFPEPSRERYLDSDELARWFESVTQEPDNTLRDFFLLSLFCGQWRANTQAMQWDHINLDRHIWTIPAAEAKADKTITVHLSKPATEILKRRKQTATTDWVFPSRSKTGHVVEPKAAWKRIIERAKLMDVRIHDLRRTFGSWQAFAGSSLQLIGKSLGHTSIAATQIYARLRDIDPVRVSVDTATDAMLSAMNGKGNKEDE